MEEKKAHEILKAISQDEQLYGEEVSKAAKVGAEAISKQKKPKFEVGQTVYNTVTYKFDEVAYISEIVGYYGNFLEFGYGLCSDRVCEGILQSMAEYKEAYDDE